MALTEPQQRDAAREWVRRAFLEANATATLNLDDIKAAVASIDETMDSLPAALTPPTLTIKQHFARRLPEPFKSGSTVQQKALALVAWALKEAGLI